MQFSPEDTNLHPCAVCGCLPNEMEISRQTGRLKDNFRVTCACGRFPSQWSVSKEAAIRLWNAASPKPVETMRE